MSPEHRPDLRQGSSASKLTVAVIGAGVSGLAAARCLREVGIDPIVFEQAGEIGGVWNYHEEEPGGGGPAYRSLHTNTSRHTSAFSDFPFLASLPDFPSRAQVVEYLNRYADHFGLRSLIRLRTQVVAVRPQSREGSRDGAAWEVVYRTMRTGEAGEPDGRGAEQTGVYDAVLVCSGLYGSPVIPYFRGLRAYTGKLLHSRDYKGPEDFEGKRIVVVGAGSSAADIAVELSKFASSLTLSTQRGAWFIPRYIGGKPYDHQLTRLSALVSFRTRMWVFQRLLLAEYRRMGIKQPQKALKSVLPEGTINVLGSRTTVSSDLPRSIASGAIQIRPGVARLEEQHVVFADSTRTEADVVLLATGYRMAFPFLDPALLGSALGEASGDRLDLYKHVFHPSLPGLAFLGMCIVAGSVIPVIEMQARWVAQVLAGAARLPPPSQMEREIQARNEWMAKVGAQPMRVELLNYMDELARQIGVRPNLAKHLPLALDLLTGPPVAAQYRLNGPGRWHQAERTVRGTRRRRAGSGMMQRRH